MSEVIKNRRGFKPGNTYGKGRPPGSKTRALLLRDHATEEDHASIMKQLIELAKEGDFQAITLYVNKVCGTPKLPSTVDVDFAKKIYTLADMDEQMTEVTYGAMTGELHLDDAAEMQKILETKGASIQKFNAEMLDIIQEKFDLMHGNR